MRVFVITRPDYDHTDVVGVVTSQKAALGLVRKLHNRPKPLKTLKIIVEGNGITATWHGGVEYYDCEPFDVSDAAPERKDE